MLWCRATRVRWWWAVDCARTVTEAMPRFLPPPTADHYEAGMKARKQALGEAPVVRDGATFTPCDRRL